MKNYFLCRADLAEELPWYTLIIEAKNEGEAQNKMRKYALMDYPDYFEDDRHVAIYVSKLNDRKDIEKCSFD